MFLRVAEAHFKSTLSQQNQPHTIALHLDFLRRTQAGPALFTVQDKKLGRQASVIHVSLSQGDRPEEVVGYITNSNIHTETGVSFSTGYALSPPPASADLALLAEDTDPNWARQGSLPFAGFRKASEKTQLYFPRGGQAQARSADEWLRLKNGERWTNFTLGYVADMWPMPVEAFITREESEAAEEGGSSRTLTKEDVRQWVRAQLSNHLVPKHVFWVKEYPKTASGKIQKFTLRETGIRLLQEAEGRK